MAVILTVPRHSWSQLALASDKPVRDDDEEQTPHAITNINIKIKGGSREQHASSLR
jgi:hypothetical protein